jgi:mannose-6-phosphate isomerase-like protein (cupin superfamily)
MKGWTAVRLDEIPKRPNGWIPVRDHLGITAFGVNAWTKRETDDDLIGVHDERSTGHEELYFVYRGHATFTVGDEEIDAPAGTIVVVKDPARRRGARPTDDDTIVVTAGGKPGEPFTVSAWERNSEWNAEAFPLYNEQRYTEAAEVLRKGIAAGADNPGMHYNLACFAALAGETDEALEHLRIAFDGDASFKEFAETDSDLDSLRDDPRYPR